MDESPWRKPWQFTYSPWPQMGAALLPEDDPHQIHQPFRNSPEWGSAFLLVPWQQYQFTGDTTLLRRHYEGMKRYVAFLGSTAKDNIVHTGLGDWYDMGPKPPWGSQLTPPPLTATAFYYYDNWILARVAELLGKPEEANEFDKRAGEIRAAFNREFFKPETGQYATGSQTANAIPLVMGLTDAQHRSQLLEAIVKDVRGRDNSLTSGDVGYRYLLRALADADRSDVIFDMNNQSDRPGYGMQLARGATSLTEKWDASVGSFGSQNHFMLGQINEWFFHDLAGIQPDPAGPGFRKIVIKPAFVGDVSWTKAIYQSIHGDIVSHWTNNPNGLTMNVTIPVGSTATIYVPAADPKQVKESGKAASSASGVKYLRTENGTAVYEVGSGSYVFSSIAVAGTPSGLNAVAGDRKVALSWNKPANGSSYTVKRSTTDGSGYTTIAKNITGTSYTDTA